MAASNYLTGEMLDRFLFSPRVLVIAIGILFLLPGIVWFATRRWWDRGLEPADELVRLVEGVKVESEV
jgi:hypothetical protein